MQDGFRELCTSPQGTVVTMSRWHGDGFIAASRFGSGFLPFSPVEWLVALGLVRGDHHPAVIDPLDALQVAVHLGRIKGGRMVLAQPGNSRRTRQAGSLAASCLKVVAQALAQDNLVTRCECNVRCRGKGN